MNSSQTTESYENEKFETLKNEMNICSIDKKKLETKIEELEVEKKKYIKYIEENELQKKENELSQNHMDSSQSNEPEEFENNKNEISVYLLEKKTLEAKIQELEAEKEKYIKYIEENELQKKENELSQKHMAVSQRIYETEEFENNKNEISVYLLEKKKLEAKIQELEAEKEKFNKHIEEEHQANMQNANLILLEIESMNVLKKEMKNKID